MGFGAGCLVSLVGALLVSAAVAVVVGAGVGAAVNSASSGEPVGSMDAVPGAESDDPMADAEAYVYEAVDAEDFEAAEQRAEALVKRFPGRDDARALLASVRIWRAVDAMDTAGAAALLTDARESALDVDPSAVLGVAELLLDNGELVRATELADRTLTEISRRPTGDEEYDAYIRGSALLIRGLARSEGGDDAGAVADLEAAVGLAPDAETAREWGALLEDVRSRAQ